MRKAATRDAPRTPMPKDLEPMLATITREPFNDPGWLFEIKWDGFRSLAYVSGKQVELRSRKNLSFTNYKPVVDALKQLGIKAVLDGEICVLNSEGKSDFEALQNWSRRQEGELVYYSFDILWLDGVSLINLPLTKRKEMLRELLPDNNIIRYSDSIDTNGTEFFEAARKNGLEGIMAKQKQSKYQPGRRTETWLKMPIEQRQEFVIGGWTESGSNRAFRSLLFGYYENGKLISVGHSGGGFKDADMKDIYSRLKKLEIKKSPFATEVETETKAHWVKPELVAEIKFASKTSGGKIRKPAIFLGFRDDKNATDVVREIEQPPTVIAKNVKQTNKKKMILAADSNWRELDKLAVTSRTSHAINSHDVELTNIEQLLWPEFTKAHLLMYYHAVWPFIGPHLKDRPLSLHVKPKGPMAPGFYIKDMEGRAPKWAALYSMDRKHKKKGKRDTIDYLVCNNEETLQYMLNLGCIDVNPWTARTVSPEQPDYIIIDLDPSDDDFLKAVDTARAAKKVFDVQKIKAFPKTSGKTGIHLYLPCRDISFPEARNIAEILCHSIHKIVPGITTTEVSVGARGSKLYLDPNQNDLADTVAAPYSFRPYKHPSISTPLEWREINRRLRSERFTAEQVQQRLKSKGDIFSGVLDDTIAEQNTRQLKRLL